VSRIEGMAGEPALRRRSLRMVMRVPLFINPADAPGTSEWEPVETLVLSLHGGMIRSRQQFPTGTTLDIRMRNAHRSTRARVVWTALGATGVSFEVGFELLEPPGFWQIKFPEDKWAVRQEGSFVNG
jgi:hypothetical protein